MSEKLNDRIVILERKIKSLEDKIIDLVSNTEDKRHKPESKIPQLDLGRQNPMPSTGTGKGRVPGRQGGIIWNDGDAAITPWGEQSPAPTKGLHKHHHSEYAGGALDIHTLKLVEYETQDPEVEDPIILDSEGNSINKHCQSSWKIQPNIRKENGIEKIGYLDIEFDTASKKWVTGANMIDVERTYLVQYVWKKEGIEVPPETEGAAREIKKDANGIEMKSPLLYTTSEDDNENLNKSNVIWNKEARCWRFYAVFKPYIEE